MLFKWFLISPKQHFTDNTVSAFMSAISTTLRAQRKLFQNDGITMFKNLWISNPCVGHMRMNSAASIPCRPLFTNANSLRENSYANKALQKHHGLYILTSNCFFSLEIFMCFKYLLLEMNEQKVGSTDFFTFLNYFNKHQN